MQKNNTDRSLIMLDIINALNISNEVGWHGLKDFNLHRIMYISSVLHSIKNEDNRLFKKLYDFDVSLRGPYSSDIKKSLDYLIAREIITKLNDELSIDNKKILSEMSKLEQFNIEVLERKEWISIVIHIIAKYGESKIYDFVFRDPEYQNNIKRNSSFLLNISEGNKTEESIMQMKKAFENVLGSEAEMLSNKKYLELYFDFVFSKIIKGDN